MMKVDEVETAAVKQGRKVCSKLEGRIKELEAELDQEQRRLTDTTKTLRKSERRIKELEFQVPISDPYTHIAAICRNLIYGS
jgi:myosin protein heavy chain/myosin heavy chain 6/7